MAEKSYLCLVKAPWRNCPFGYFSCSLAKQWLRGATVPLGISVAHLPNNGSVAQLSPLGISVAHLPNNGSVAQLYSASDFGSEGWGLESLRGHKTERE